MIGQVHWLSMAVLFVAAIPVAFLLIRDRLENRKYRVEHQRVRCRARGNQLAECTLVRDAATGVPLGIRDCSAYGLNEHCQKTCLPLFVSS